MLNTINNGKKRWILFSLLYVGFILFLSTQKSGSALGHSVVMEAIRNLMHIPLYGILSLFLIRALYGFVGLLPASAAAMLVGVSVGCLDEYVQSFTPGRTVSVGDVMLDLTGICLAIGLVFIVKKIMIGGGSIDGNGGRNS